MASQPPDYFGAMGGVGNMVDPSAAVSRGLMDILKPQAVAAQGALFAQQARQAQIGMARQQAFTDAASGYAANPTPNGLRQLFSFPEYAEAAKQMYDVSDEQQRRTNTTQLGSAMALAAKGDYAGAAAIAQARYDADKRAGIENPGLKNVIDLLNGTPAQQREATAAIGAHLAGAIGVDAASKFMEENGFSNKPVALGLEQRLVNPATNETLVGASPKLENVSRTLPTGETSNTAFNPYTGTYGAAAAPGAAPADASGAAPATGTSAPATGSRADRNNNPGNLRAVNPRTGQPVSWVTSLPGYQGADPQGYAIFAPGTTGQQGQQALLSRYFSQGRNTVSSIVEHWAPRQSAGGDNTDAQVNNYVSYVAHQMGVDPNKPLPPAAIPQLAAAMHRFESGATGKAGNVRVPPAQQSIAPNPAAVAAPAQTDPYSFGPAAGSAAINTKGAPAGYAWNADHTAVVPIPGGEQDLSAYPPAMVHDAAVELLTTGQMPSMGMGGAAIKKAILDERSRIMQQAHISADQLPTFRARYGADKKALENISGIASGLQASEGALKPYMDQVLSAQQKLATDGIIGDTPIFNHGRLLTAENFGTAQQKQDIKKYRDAINALQVEYGKFMSSASGMSNAPTTDSARNLASDLTDETLPPLAMKGHMQQLQTEARIKLNSVLSQRQAMEQRLSSYLQPQGPGTAAQVRSVQQYNALPKGARYIDPSGVHRVKQ